jgi:anti-sigma regulatory factor (Ser/Thr protein kinase)
MGEDALQDVLTVIGEAFANAVQHAQTLEPIELTAWLEDNRFLARIVDRGSGFAEGVEPQAPRHPAEELAECGRGMWIMNSCADSLSVESLPGIGTAIVFARSVRGGPNATGRNA